MTRLSPWAARALAARQADPVRTVPHDAHRALHDFGSAEPPGRRLQYFSVANGQQVSVWSSLGPEEGQRRADEKAAFIERHGAEAYDGRRHFPPRNIGDENLAALGLDPAKYGASDPSAPSTPTQGAADQPNASSPTLWSPEPAAGMTKAPGGRQHANAGPTLTQCFEWYLGRVKQTSSRRRATYDAAFILRILLELTGDKPARLLDRSDVERYVHAMSVWPKHASKSREFRHMAAPEIVSKAERLRTPAICHHTQQIYIDRLRRFLRFLEDGGDVRPGLLKGCKVYSPSRDKGNHRQPFTDEELAQIFAPAVTQAFAKPWQYWIPLIALYQGMRVSEIAQLYVDDIHIDLGLPTMTVSDERRGQRLKTPGARRILPIHPKLIELGLPELVAQARKWKRGTLFPGMRWGETATGHMISAWFRPHLHRTIGIARAKLCFHSFRHNFANAAEVGNVPYERIARLMGHSFNLPMLEIHYFQARPPKHAMDDMKALVFPELPHVPYDPKQFEAAFAHARAREEGQGRRERAYPASATDPTTTRLCR